MLGRTATHAYAFPGGSALSAHGICKIIADIVDVII